ncbi:MAG TPA: DUF3311 domain-containing protein [Chthonomonadales bacterium]|nr:DUF3311 domain-containing protein [Chthonomonadales bacterium]
MSRRSFKWILTLIVIVVIVLHQDIWLWTDKRLVFGFLPIGLAYHVGYMFLASATMALLVRFAWPKELEKVEVTPSPQERS